MLLLVFYSCDRNKKEAIDSIVKKWMGKEILFPENSLFITYDNRDSVDFLSMKSDYRIVTYVNSETCFSCNLRLPFWKGFVMEVDSVSLDKNIPVLVYCRSGRRSEMAGKVLSEKGYKVYDFGGIIDWPFDKIM